MPNARSTTLLAVTVLALLSACGKQQPPAEKAPAAQEPAASAPASMPHPMPTAEPEDEDLALTGITKAEGGKTVAEIYAERDALAGTQVMVRGKVVKTNPDIMDKNWLHVRDGSGEEGTNDLTVTTSAATPAIGATVLVSGTLAVNKDFGMGYVYPVVLEDAEVTVE